MSEASPTLRDVPPVQRRRKLRDLERAVWLRPRDVTEIYGISAETAASWATDPDPAERLPSFYKKTTKGAKKGIRIYRRSDFDAYMARHMSAAA
jgi:hypothetical protein